ncbi:MAG: hypothetical protein JOS17DRAFT_778590 [Linnemannia elongata]|nr:MAG: hypothetical protein JOS17DRAFT_778590 [Linnemannia elongata]
MIEQVRHFPIVSGGDKFTTVGDLIDVDPRERVSKVVHEEKVVHTKLHAHPIDNQHQGSLHETDQRGKTTDPRSERANLLKNHCQSSSVDSNNNTKKDLPARPTRR